ncbi:FAD-dependent monooxygenase [Streptomyces sp. NPDC051104]|uniref:FAD-dependent monooxygenase n=1 Tax=Streptomyces sp. NPDC051104 TaxID=3155044 RepID=UPI00341200A5
MTTEDPNTTENISGLDGGGMGFDVDVLVVGAGPVGLALTLDLARRGVRVRLVDREEGTFPGSRAKGVQPRTLEVFDDLGVLDAALAAGDRYPPMGLHLGPFSKKWVMQKPLPTDPTTPYPDILLLPQSATTAILRDAVEAHSVQIGFGIGVEGVDQDAQSATALLSNGEQVRVRYLVGADGGSSTVRKSCGLRFEGATDESDRMIIVDGAIDGLSRDRWHVWPRAGGRFVGACPLPGGDQFQLMIKLRPDDPVDLTDPALAALFDRLVGGSLRLRNITWSSLFRPNVRLAEHYCKGRVLLCGDAAHVHTPAGAEGLNTGVQDAYNLGWKLEQVLAGAPEGLLGSYEGERRPVAAQVLGRSTELYEGLKRVRPSKFTRGGEDRQLGISYYGGPLAPTDSGQTVTLRVGDRAPDAFLPHPSSRPTRRLFDLYRGPHFTLLAFGEQASVALRDIAWPSRGTKLHRHTATRRAVPVGPAEEALLTAYGITGDTLLLIRPDGYIGHIDTAGWDTRLDSVARRMTPAAQTTTLCPRGTAAAAHPSPSGGRKPDGDRV